MREIKFRAWDNEFKKMKQIDIQEGFDSELLLMQFTGLKDKNGKEIYEGDILKLGDEDKEPKTTFSEVYWCEYQSKFMHKRRFLTGGGSAGELNTWNNYLDGIKDLDFCEVIGNIYENPELLKEKKE